MMYIEENRRAIRLIQNSTRKKIIRSLRAKYGDDYDYSDAYFNEPTEEITINCNKCGNTFKEVAFVHLRGVGCPKCIESSFTEDTPKWAKDAMYSVAFNGFKVYIVELWDKTGPERFYKIGMTRNPVEDRLRKIPYSFNIIKVINKQKDWETVMKLEQRLQNHCIEYKYIPNKKFVGKDECFSSVEPIMNVLDIEDE